MPVKPKPRYDAHRNQWTIYHRGKRHYLCAGAANEARAWNLADTIRRTSPGDVTSTPHTVVEAVAAWLEQRGGKWHRDILSPFIRFGAGTGLDCVHPEYLDDYNLYLQKQGYIRNGKRRDYAPSTIRRQLRFARCVLEWAHVRGYFDRAVPFLPKLPRIETKDRSIDAETLNRVFGNLPDRARAVLTFQLLTGCRPSEACQLTHDEIQGDVCELRRGKTFARTGQPRLIQLSPTTRALIKDQPTTTGYVFLNRNRQPYKPSGLRSILQRAGKKEGLTLTGAYLLRHSWAQAAYDTGLIGLAELGAMMGHEHGSPMTKIYAKMRRKRITEAAKSLGEPIILDHSPTSPEPKASGKPNRRKDGQPNRRKTAKGRASRQAG